MMLGKKAQLGVIGAGAAAGGLGWAWFILAAAIGIIVILFGAAGIGGLFKFLFTSIKPLGPLGIFFVGLVIILILRRR